MVHQHFMLVPPFTVTENVILGSEPKRGAFIDYNTGRKEVASLSLKFGLNVDADAKIEELSVGIQERVEILKLLYRGADILILDEPTAVLTPQETEELFKIIRSLKEQGKTIILITHKLEEVFAISDRITVMRQGKVVGVVNTSETNKDDLARMMVGRSVLFKVEKEKAKAGDVVLKLKDVCAESSRKASELKKVNLAIKSGEIHGIAGVEGNGQTELAEVITGLREIKSGKISFKGETINDRSPRELYQLGISLIPQDRQKEGLILDFPVYENLILGIHHKPPYSKGIRLNFGAIMESSKNLVKEFDIRPPDPNLPVRALSGGNQQKVIIAREFSKNPDFIVAAHPTRGVDIGGIEFIHKKLLEARDRGVGVMLISADLSELLSLSDRISVIYEGKIVGTFKVEQVDEFQLGYLMTGGKGKRKNGEVNNANPK